MPSRPNLLFLYTDEQSANTLGAYGNIGIETPHLDALAAQSVIFDHAYVTQPVCTPSRSSLLTGLYPHTSGLVRNNLALPPEIGCLPELGDFSDYRTAHFGKWHLGDEVFPQHGFQEWRSIEDQYRPHYRPGRDLSRHSTYHEFLIKRGFEPDAAYDDGFRYFSREHSATFPEEVSKPAYVADEAIRFIEESQDQPFILYVNFLEPHFPLHGPRDDQYDPAEMPLPPNFDHPPTEDQWLKAQLLYAGLAEWGFEGKPLKTEEDWQRIIAHYWGLVSQVDTHMGRILRTLRDCSLEDDTIIVYTSEHGDMMGAHRLLAKAVMFEEALKVPLMLRIPGVTQPGQHIAAPVGQIDVVPTLLDALGMPLPDHLEGASWLPHLRGEAPLAQENVFIEWNGNDGWGHAIRKGQILESQLAIASEERIRAAMRGDPARGIITPQGFKYVWWQSGHRELYDLRADPGETTNLAGRSEHQPTVAALQDEIRRWQQQTNDSLRLPD